MKVGHVKITFGLNSDDWHGYRSETLWAKPLVGSEMPNVFELENSPFYAKGVSFLDVVRAVERDGQYQYAGTVAPSGHSTYRLIVDRCSDKFEIGWKKLQDMGCTYESGDFQEKKLFTVDVPATTDIYAVYKILEEGEKENVWMFEEGHVGHPLKDKPANNPSGRA